MFSHVHMPVSEFGALAHFRFCGKMNSGVVAIPPPRLFHPVQELRKRATSSMFSVSS